jgi:hypothetical protein
MTAPRSKEARPPLRQSGSSPIGQEAEFSDRIATKYVDKELFSSNADFEIDALRFSGREVRTQRHCRMNLFSRS